MNKKTKETLIEEINKITLENSKLKLENMKLQQEKQEFKKQLEDLNENTIIQSMNDMKIRYEQLEMNSVPYEKYDYVTMLIVEYKKQNITIDKINDKNKIELETFYNNYKNTTMDKTKIFDKLYSTYSTTFRFIDMILNESDDDEQFQFRSDD